MAGELPGKGLGGLLVTLLKGDEVFGQNLKVGEVVGGEYLTLNHREVDLDLALSQEAWVGRWMRRRLGHSP